MHLEELLPQGEKKPEQHSFLSERTMLSLHVVLVIVVCVVWIIRLSDRVDAQNREIQRIEFKLHMDSSLPEGTNGHDEQ